MARAELEDARLDLLLASSALDCVLSMLDQMPDDAKITPPGLVALLQPVFGRVSAALDNVS